MACTMIEVTYYNGQKQLLPISDILSLTKLSKEEVRVGKKTLIERKNGEQIIVREGYRWLKAQMQEALE